MKPLLVFGLRGTLVERIHVRKIPDGMPAADLTVGLTKVWLRPHMLETLAALQKSCNIAIWSSTTARNTTPLVDAVFNSPRLWEAAGVLSAEAGGAWATHSNSPASPSSPADANDAKDSSATGKRFSKRPKDAPGLERTTSPQAAFTSPLTFQFVWSREHTAIDEFRRMNTTIRDDAHATVKDLDTVWRQYPTIATPANTVLIDDTASKAKLHADNFLWLDTCEAFAIQDADGMKRLRQFVEEEIVGAPDVRAVLPRRVRGSVFTRPSAVPNTPGAPQAAASRTPYSQRQPPRQGSGARRS